MIILAPAFFIMGQYHGYYMEYSEKAGERYNSHLISEDFLEDFLEISYILGNSEQGDADGERNALSETDGADLGGQLWESYETYKNIYPYLDYRVEGKDGAVVNQSTANTGTVLTADNLKDYYFGVMISYDHTGVPDIEKIYGKLKEEQSLVFRRIISNTDSGWNMLIQEGDDYGCVLPRDRTYYYGITEDNLRQYLTEYVSYYGNAYVDMSDMNNAILFLTLLVVLVAWSGPFLPFWKAGDGKLFRVPFEAAALVFLFAFCLITDHYEWLLKRSQGRAGLLDFVCWAGFYAVTFWAATCFRQIYELGTAAYVRERTVLYPSRTYIRKGWRFVKGKVSGWCRRFYHSLESIDLREDGNKMLLKIVLCNFALLAVICFMWFFGIAALVIYSVILFFLLRKYYNDLREKYHLLLNATNQIAEGNLEVEITEDLGVFTPFRTEIAKIQAGFRKAVEEEVKSQRMKTELVTNVSHDLKTPLTAIITYVNLLKEEKDETKQKDYIAVLERKSLRLKALIEDLFEISKASSKNITLNIVEVDLVGLFKQVKLELEDKLNAAEIDFRCSYPGEKLTVWLDSQKTCRIFENLLVNISKYAMPHTRAYVEIRDEGTEAVIRMKNVSAAELSFNPEEITDRFVRGDLSRNTEGSGLGLAIVKSFTELQKGKFTIETEADLFKAELRFKKNQTI